MLSKLFIVMALIITAGSFTGCKTVKYAYTGQKLPKDQVAIIYIGPGEDASITHIDNYIFYAGDLTRIHLLPGKHTLQIKVRKWLTSNRVVTATCKLTFYADAGVVYKLQSNIIMRGLTSGSVSVSLRNYHSNRLISSCRADKRY